MQKPFSLILYALLGVVVLNLVFSVTHRSHINDVIKNLEQSQRNIGVAIKEIQASRNRLDSIQADLTKFKYYIRDIQQTVTLMDVEKRIKENNDKKILDTLKSKREVLKQSLAINDSLPPITVKRL